MAARFIRGSGRAAATAGDRGWRPAAGRGRASWRGASAREATGGGENGTRAGGAGAGSTVVVGDAARATHGVAGAEAAARRPPSAGRGTPPAGRRSRRRDRSGPGRGSPKASTTAALRTVVAEAEAHPVAPAVDVVGPDVELGVAEAVDPQHLGGQAGALGPRQRHDARQQRDRVDRLAQLGQVDAVAQVGGGRPEHVAAGERRARRRRAGSARLVSTTARPAPPAMATAGARRPLSGPTSTPSPPPTSTADGPAVGAHAGVDDGEHDPARHVLDAAGQGQRAGRGRRRGRCRG